MACLSFRLFTSVYGVVVIEVVLKIEEKPSNFCNINMNNFTLVPNSHLKTDLLKL